MMNNEEVMVAFFTDVVKKENKRVLFKPEGWCMPGFLKLFFLSVMSVCVFVCLPPRLLIISVVIWFDMEPL